MKCGIYYIKNKINGMSYVGQSTNLRQRFAQQKSDLKADRHSNEHLQAAVKIYGIGNFQFKIIAYCLPTELDRLEKFYIREYGSNIRGAGYNIEDGGRNDKTIAQETKIKQSAIRTGRPQPESAKAKWRENRKREKNSRARRVICTETGHVWGCAKELALAKGINYHTLVSKLQGRDNNNTPYKYETNNCKLRVIKRVVDIITGQEWDTYADAAIEKGLNPGTLRKYLSGHRKNITTLRYA